MTFLHVSPRAHYLLLLSQDPNLFVSVAVNKSRPVLYLTSALLTYLPPFGMSLLCEHTL